METIVSATTNPELAEESAERAFLRCDIKALHSAEKGGGTDLRQHLECNWVMTQFRHVEIQFDHCCADTEVRFVGLGVHLLC